ncbi:mechanosensitive ion channel protein MscS [Jeotgalibacillus malaysiensis]|uniref:Mechanosensitive ion channel protein MscS n=1 Tax=Jeotgalibacillus malaysiensis TaxID=1508404 RepID=A0A0B5AWP1_9BACL|nr:mechanosensitive ion channel family protein [Jeotgalibacillus malaysiensis]AJD93003.1 mechanosensitive ion channel protein MscS [Jeotgalibacillus malaysiensis]
MKLASPETNDTPQTIEEAVDVGALTEAWDSIVAYLTNEAVWVQFGIIFLRIVLIIVIAGIVVRVAKKLIQNVFKVRAKGPVHVSIRRENTLLKLLQNVVSYVVYFVAVLAVLSAFEIDVRGLIAGAGIVGLAVGFGAQNLVRDIITGFFIIFEDQFSVGDYVRIGQAEGHVEEIGLRTTKIKSWTGELHIFPNGNITEVTNFSIHNSVAVVDVSIAYEEDVAAAEQAIREFCDSLEGKYEEVVMKPELLGVQTLGASEVVMRVIAETQPMKHWYIAREMRREIKHYLDERGIEIPFPRMVMYSREEAGKLQTDMQEKVKK